MIYNNWAIKLEGRDIITSIAESLIRRAVILVIAYVEIFKTDTIVFIGNVVMLLMSHWETDNLQIQSKSLDTDNIHYWDQKKNL